MKEIEVRYGMGQRYSFVNIDGKRLGQALTEIGYNTDSIRPLAVGNEPDSSFAKCRETDVFINQSRYLKETRGVYGLVGRIIDEKAYPPKPNLLRSISENGFQRTLKLNIVYKPGRKKYPNKLFEGNQTRRRKYLKEASYGSSEMQSKAKKFMQQQLIRALRRQVAKVIAHEYQHGKDFHNDIVTTLKYMLTPGTISAVSFLLAGMDASSTIASAGVGVLIGKIAAERKMEEDAMKAEKNWRLIMPAIEINKEVLDEEVFT